MKRHADAFNEMLSKLGGSQELRLALEMYSVAILQAQKQICADAIKLVHIREGKNGEAYIRVADAQADIMDARLPIKFETVNEIP